MNAREKCEPDNHDSRGALERLVDQVQADHRAKQKRSRNSQYAGVRTNTNRRNKYEGCEYMRICGGVARRLTDKEIDEFRARMQRLMDPKSGQVEVPSNRRAIV